ncbi:unnamed protein product [Boreogadus saida]
MDEESEEGDPTSKTALSGEHGRRSKAKRVLYHRTPKLDSATSPGNGSTPRVETHAAKFTVSVAARLTPVPGFSEEWDVILRKHLERRQAEYLLFDQRRQQSCLVLSLPECTGNREVIISGDQAVQQQRADSPGPSCVSMKSGHSMDHPLTFKDGYHQPSKKRRRQERADSPGPRCVSMKSDWSMSLPPELKDGRPSREERHQERSMVTSALSVQQHLPELEINQEELANTLGGGKRLLL